MSIVIDAMASDQTLWKCYFTDFITHKLKLDDPSHLNEDIPRELLNTYFEQLHDHKMPNKLVELHCHANIYYLCLAQRVTLLRSLGKMVRE